MISFGASGEGPSGLFRVGALYININNQQVIKYSTGAADILISALYFYIHFELSNYKLLLTLSKTDPDLPLYISTHK